jgi:ATP-binding cassette subfamily B protein
MVFTSFAEILSIGSVLPFLIALTAPDQIFQYSTLQPIFKMFGLSESKQILFPLTIVFCIAAFIAGGMRLLLLWVSTRLSFAAGADISINIYRRTLYQSYPVHCARNSSEIIDGISVKSNTVIYSVIIPIITIITSSFMLTAILIALLLVDPIITLGAFMGLVIIYVIIASSTRKKLLINSQRIACDSALVIKSIQEGLGGIREVLLEGTQETYCQIYRDADLSLRRAQGGSLFIGASPRYGMEALGMILIALLSLLLAKQSGDIATAIPILGVLALGAQRLLPVLQQLYSSWATIRAGMVSLQDTLDLLDQPLPNDINQDLRAPLGFKNQIALKNLSFRYSPESPWILKDVNLSISKGSRTGFVGVTGSGKSTLLDIVMGLLTPTYGSLEVDGRLIDSKNLRSWQCHIAHVPQFIYLTDGTIEENIAFGIPKNKIDFKRVMQAAEQAEIALTIKGWENQYQTLVGERGIRLSGGQRQRIGIARALYKEADVIILDEATSSLDVETEESIMHSIDRLSKDLTILIIAHRITTLKGCTQIIECGNLNVKNVGSYEDIAP